MGIVRGLARTIARFGVLNDDYQVSDRAHIPLSWKVSELIISQTKPFLEVNSEFIDTLIEGNTQ